MTESTADGAVGKAIKSYFREFGALKSCGREFWVVQLVNLLDGVAYFAMLTLSTLYLSETLGYNDADAANLWAACMAAYTLTGCAAGFLGDSIGIKRTLYLSVGLLIASRLVISFSEARSVVIPALFTIAVGTAIMTPILISATKRYTNPKTQTAGFNLLYLLMNIGAFIGNVTFDPLRELPWGNRSIFMVGSAMSILCWLSIMFFWRRGIDKVDARATSAKQDDDAADFNAPEESEQSEKGEKWEPPWVIAAEVFRESAFWRFMLFLVVLIGVRLVFEHQYQIYPKYYLRTMGDFMFRTEAGAQGELESGSIPKEIREQLESQGISLPNDFAVSPTVKGKEWRVGKKKKGFLVRADTQRLEVSRLESPDTLLFSLDGGTASQLNEARVPDKLFAVFSENDVAIPRAVKVKVQEPGRKWKLTFDDDGKDKAYYLRNDEGALSVYAQQPPIGYLNSINPFIICIGVIISTPIVARFKLFNVLLFGITVSASSMLLLVIYPGWFIHWFGLTLSQGYATIAITQIVIFSIGEAIWSPRLYEYTAAIAPAGREASYMGLSYLPMFAARFAEGPIAGYLLENYAPPDIGSRLETVGYMQSPQFMCLLLAGLAIASPILVVVLRGVIQKEAAQKM